MGICDGCGRVMPLQDNGACDYCNTHYSVHNDDPRNDDLNHGPYAGL